MTVETLSILYDYNYWANDRLFQVILQLNQEEYTQPVAGGYGSIRNTLVHVLSTEWGWLSRCGGQERGPSLNAEDFPTVESLIEEWAAVEKYVREFLSGLVDVDLERTIKYKGKGGRKCSMPMGELLHHSIIHGAHHRGQVAILLRELGYAPGSFDILFYYAEKRNVSAW